MTKWLKAVFAEAKNIDLKEFEPTNEVIPGDHVVAVMDDQHKKLYALAESYRKKAEEAIHWASCRVSGRRTSQMIGDCLKEALTMQRKVNAIMEIFHASIRDAHDLWGENIAIRKGWKVVRVAIEEIPNRTRFDFAKTFHS